MKTCELRPDFGSYRRPDKQATLPIDNTVIKGWFYSETTEACRINIDRGVFLAKCR
jgi:hypothetical protein